MVVSDARVLERSREHVSELVQLISAESEGLAVLLGSALLEVASLLVGDRGRGDHGGLREIRLSSVAEARCSLSSDLRLRVVGVLAPVRLFYY